jgi:transcriptional regulator with GAF, ATPase, and Fis domain
VRHGASDLLVWSPQRDTIGEIVARVTRWDEVDRLVSSPLVRDNMVGSGAAWTLAARRLVEAARFSDAPVLLLGETGTGKELAARLVHALDARQNKRGMIVVDCGTLAPDLSGSELFGHVRGAYTGAVDGREGAFAIADGGTLFLDEIGELPLRLQPELLRAVQERMYKRLGSNVWRETSFRLVSATNRDLPADVDEGRFRRDLYYRIASVAVRLPPLRERVEDIVPLAEYFVAQLTRDGSAPRLDDSVREYLTRRTYPGNVRDLKQLVARIMQRHVGPGPITVGDIPPDERPDAALPGDWRDEMFERAVRKAVAQGAGMKEISHAATELAIEIAVEVEGNLANAARRLGVTDRALQMRRAAKRQLPGTPADD